MSDGYRVLFKLGGWLLVDELSVGGSRYMRRFQLGFRHRQGFRVHHIYRSDADRALHDHPFDFASVILWGGYWEHRPGGRRDWRGFGSLQVREAESFHRLELPPGRTCWTFVVRGPYRRQWGFAK